MAKSYAWPASLREILRILLLLGLTTLTWAGSCVFFVEFAAVPIASLQLDSLFTVLFGASSIALVVLSFLVTALGIFGWQSIKKYIDKRVSEAVKNRTQALENELRGRTGTVLGYALGEMSLAPPPLRAGPAESPGSFVASTQDRLAEAVRQCEEGYKYLKEVGGAPAALGLNNLVYYNYSLLRLDRKSIPVKMLTDARTLRDLGIEHGNAMLKLTACRVILECDVSPQEKEQARQLLREIEEGGSKATKRERSEAGFYLKTQGASKPGPPYKNK